VLGEINSRGAGVKIALIDASRRNPFERRFRSFSAGLAPGDRAERHAGDVFGRALVRRFRQWQRPQPVRQELLKEIRTPDLMAEETLNRTRVGVTRASRQEQVPWISSSLAEDFSFIPSGSGPTAHGLVDSGGHGACNATLFLFPRLRQRPHRWPHRHLRLRRPRVKTG
jgi:hypothetical protein